MAGGGEARSSEDACNERRAKGPQFQGNVTSEARAGIGESLATPEKLWKLQETLRAKAKGNPACRFYSLYDKLYREDVLAEAWRRCRANKGASGVDDVSFSQIEARGVTEWLGQLAQDLRNKQYKPGAVRRVLIPKPNGKQRPLGIPTIRDRVVQMAAVLILEPIFESDLPDEQHGYRSGRSPQGAVREVHQWLNRGLREVVDADLSGYFDTIPHRELLKSLARRISDGAMLSLLKNWLVMPVEESDGRGGRRRSNPARRKGKGTPQGAPISPLLANLYMRRFILGWKHLGYESRFQARIVNYADEFVILCRDAGQEAYAAMEVLMDRLNLVVNSEKTRICRLPEDSFDFLGYTFGECYSTATGRKYLGTRPSRKKIAGIMHEIGLRTSNKTVQADVARKVVELNALLRGWGNYFCLGPVSKSYRAIDAHSRFRLRQWLRKKHKKRGRATAAFPDEYLYETLGLVRLERTTRNLPWAKA
jgi:group II intron reverse transcriptase/maturase